jgi:hypothetical protein
MRSTRHVGRRLVGFIDVDEAIRLTTGDRDVLVAIGIGRLDDLRGLAARAGNDAVGVGLRFVAQPVLILLGRLHVAEGVDDLRRRTGDEQLDLRDLHAGAILVELLLHELLDLGLDAEALLGQNALDVRAADDLAHGAFGRRLHGAFDVLDVEEEITRIVDDPLHRKIDVDDVLVAREHQALFRHLAVGAARAAAGAVADLGAADVGDGHLEDRAEGRRRVPVEARRGVADVATEHGVHAHLVLAHRIEAGEAVDDHAEDGDEGDALGADVAATARQDVLQALLAATDQFLEVRGLIAAATTAAAALGTLPPGTARSATAATARAAAAPGAAAALIVPRHELSSLDGRTEALLTPSGA